MNSTLFQLVFEGEVESGHDPQGVRQTLAELFELDDEHQARLFGGKPIVLSKGMDAATASSFKQVLAGAGAVSRIVADTDSVAAGAAEERRSGRRRIQANRRARARNGAIVPDRRGGDRRKS